MFKIFTVLLKKQFKKLSEVIYFSNVNQNIPINILILTLKLNIYKNVHARKTKLFNNITVYAFTKAINLFDKLQLFLSRYMNVLIVQTCQSMLRLWLFGCWNINANIILCVCVCVEYTTDLINILKWIFLYTQKGTCCLYFSRRRKKKKVCKYFYYTFRRSKVNFKNRFL